MEGRIFYTAVGVVLGGVFFALAQNLLSADFSFRNVNIDNVAAFMALLLGCVGLVWMMMYSLQSSDASRIKLIGSGLVLSLAFAANNVWTYSLSIFIVATLVTELQFLEKLAALFTNRDKYWEYLARQSTPDQVKSSAILEALNTQTENNQAETDVDADQTVDQSPEPPITTSSQSDPLTDGAEASAEGTGSDERFEQKKSDENANKYLMHRADDILKFQKVSIKALESLVEFMPGATVSPNMHFSAPGNEFEVDALLKLDSHEYVVEIKNVLTSAGVRRGIEALERLMFKYTRFCSMLGGRKPIRGILILPKGVWVKRRPVQDILVLELDVKSAKLTQVDGAWT
ncbi:hypothetical protein NRB16_24645 [Pseudomonas sp. LJDD11]|uniref:hypothetical protein n=1 Tax=Pseudomonas sp. LJDD11 TaxID=2931984 RepID=UPI00211BB017|nr:hypothetical protein [Pseudomonas sp. LJDD11]MCQ9426714.1 hypothetical protein [Pseudomonas sp. LJDD11]